MKSNRAFSHDSEHHHDFRSANDEDDPYGAPSGNAVCPTCKASYAHGKWTWDKPAEDAASETCPACRRIHDQFPAGYVTIKGEFFSEHKDEIIALLKSHEKHEKSSRPLQRIIAIDQKRDGAVEVSTTDRHIARTLAEALHDAYKGDLKLRYSRDENLLRATWKR